MEPTEQEIRDRIAYYKACWKDNVEPDVYPRWHTPIEYIEAVRQVMGGIDLDPASCDIAQKRIQAKIYFTPEDDAFSHVWQGRIFLNPYHIEEDKWFGKALSEYRAGNVTEGIILTHTKRTYDHWFHDLCSASSAACFIKGRIKWIADHVIDEIAAKRCGITLDIKHDKHGSVFFYLGRNHLKFMETFKKYGSVLCQMKS